MGSKSYEFVIVGGGVVGSAIAFGLANKGHAVAVVDGKDHAYRASRGNFGLIWVQGKGIGMPCYSTWTQRSARLWHELAAELHDLTGINVHYQGQGGVELCRTEAEMVQRENELQQLHEATGGLFRFKMLDHKQLADLVPVIGPHVAGASWCELDSHVNPLKLLLALQQGLIARGGTYIPNMTIARIKTHASGSGYCLQGYDEALHGSRVILAAGLGNRALAPQLGLTARLHANRGQIIITERTKPLLDIPTALVRQTDDGTIQIGDSHEDVGMDDGTLNHVLASMAREAIHDFPILRDVRVIRGWGCLRIMTPDGFPVYDQSATHPGAFMVNCHSGVTLAAVHAKCLSAWFVDNDRPSELMQLTTERWNVQTRVTG